MILNSLILGAAMMPAALPLQSGEEFERKYLQVGKVVPNIEGKDQNGKSFNLSSYRGKVVVLDFFGFW